MCLVLVAVAGCADEPSDITCDSQLVRVERVTIPINNATAREVALDLDGDKSVDNTAGMVSGSLHGQIPGFDLSAAATARLAEDIAWTFEISECSDGTAQVAIDDEPALAGEAIDGRIHARGTAGRMPISTLWDPSASFATAGFVRAKIAAVDMQQLGDGHWEGRLAMGFAPAELIDAIVAPLAPYFDEHQLFMEYLDVAPADGHITADELRQANVVKSWFAPDLDRLGTSFAIGFSAR